MRAGSRIKIFLDVLEMENVLVRTKSSVGESNLHLQITPAYRQDIFVDQGVWELVLVYIKEKLDKIGVILLAAECGTDHAHIFLANWKNYSIPYYIYIHHQITLFI